MRRRRRYFVKKTIWREGGREKKRVEGVGGLETSLSATLLSQRIAPILIPFSAQGPKSEYAPPFFSSPSSEKNCLLKFWRVEKERDFSFRIRVFLGGRSFCGANIGSCHHRLRSHSFYIALDTCEELWACCGVVVVLLCRTG